MFLKKVSYFWESVIASCLIFDMISSQTCNTRYCIFPHKASETLTTLEDAQESCWNKMENSFPLEIYNNEVFDLIQSSLENKTDFWKHHVLLNMEEKISKNWFYIDEITKSPKPLPDDLGTSPFDSKNYMTIYRNPNILQFQFVANYGYESFPVVCSRPSTEEECSMESSTHFYLNQSCYVIVDGSFTWYGAQKECNLKNLSMASFVNVDLNSTTMTSILNQSQYWVAITRSLWYWKESGEYVLFSHWMLDMPSQSSDHNCVYFVSKDNDNRWFRKNCNNDFAIICMTDNQRSSLSYRPVSKGSALAPGSVAGIVLGVIVIVTIVSAIIATIVITKRTKTS